MLVKIHSQTPNGVHIKLAVDALLSGELIIFPTDTLYGLGCDIHNKNAINNIYKLKGIKKPKPLSIIFSDFKQIAEYEIIPNAAFRLMKKSYQVLLHLLLRHPT